MDKIETEVVTKEEMDGFIESLFAGPNPKCDPAWDGELIDNSQLGEDVELVSQDEVNSFISGLFVKTNE